MLEVTHALTGSQLQLLTRLDVGSVHSEGPSHAQAPVTPRRWATQVSQSRCRAAHLLLIKYLSLAAWSQSSRDVQRGSRSAPDDAAMMLCHK